VPATRAYNGIVLPANVNLPWHDHVRWSLSLKCRLSSQHQHLLYITDQKSSQTHKPTSLNAGCTPREKSVVWCSHAIYLSDTVHVCVWASHLHKLALSTSLQVSWCSSRCA
jgi:hypothetical protein